MSDFKLLGIRPTTNCDGRFLKNLTENHLYKFYSDFEFINDDYEQISEIIDNSSLPKDLFGKNVSVSAIVGKNGSGKSALIELFVACLNQFSFYLNNNKFLNKKQIVTDAKIESIEFSEQSLGLNAEIFFQIDSTFYLLKIHNNSFKYIYNISNDLQIKKGKLISFFYTLLINYSIYSFNPFVLGKKLDFNTTENHWIDGLFHKNDSYQIPIVINPKRESADNKYSGVIDINNEQDLLQQRLLYNILKFSNDDHNLNLIITDNRRASSIIKGLKSFSSINLYTFQNDHSKSSNKVENCQLFWQDAINNPLSFGIQLNGRKKKDVPVIFWKYDQVLLKTLIKFNIVENKNPYIEKCYEYIVYKIFSICEKYPDYQGFLKWDNKVELTINIGAFLQYITIKKNRSHITNKLLQVINFIKYYDEIWSNYEGEVFDIIDLSKDLQRLSIVSKFPLIELLPPPIFSLKIELESIKDVIKNKITIDRLSSGEQQLLHSTSTVFYHLSNLQSVKSTPLINRYTSVNLIFDEIELYFHPEYQRKFLKSILDGLKNNQLNNFNINILFVTHSPFILSDIPTQNILKLDEGKVIENEISQNTFGANIHDLLANDFFLKNGFMGEFAKSEINQVINFLNGEKLKNIIEQLEFSLNTLTLEEDKKEVFAKLNEVKIKISRIENIESKVDKNYCKKLIEMIGEPMLSSSLMELFTEAYPLEKKDYISAQINRLSNLIKKDDSDTYE